MKRTLSRPKALFPVFAPFALYFAALFLVYGAVVTGPTYAYADDYAQVEPAVAALHGHPSGLMWLQHMFVLGGRPLQVVSTALTLGLAAHASDPVDALRWVRLFTLVGMALLAVVFHRRLARQGAPAFLTWLTALAMLLTTPWQVTAGWATLEYLPWGALLAVGAAHFIERATAYTPIWWRFPNRWRRLLYAFALLSLSLALYQPAALVMWTYLAIGFVWPAPYHAADARPLWQRFGVALGVFITALGLNDLLARALPKLLYPSLPDTYTRTATVTLVTLWSHLQWFALKPFGPLDYALTQVLPAPHPDVALVAGLLILLLLLVGVFAGSGAPLALKLTRLALALLLVPLTFAPSLLLVEEWTSLRTLCALAPLLTLYAALGLAALYRAGRVGGTFVVPSLALALTLVFALLAFRNITIEWVYPNAADYAHIQTLVADAAYHPLTITACVQPDYQEPGRTPYRSDEFYYDTCIIGWAVESQTRLAAQDPTLQITFLPWPQSAPATLPLPTWAQGLPAWLVNQ